MWLSYLQYCAKEMRPNFDLIRALFSLKLLAKNLYLTPFNFFILAEISNNDRKPLYVIFSTSYLKFSSCVWLTCGWKWDSGPVVFLFLQAFSRLSHDSENLWDQQVIPMMNNNLFCNKSMWLTTASKDSNWLSIFDSLCAMFSSNTESESSNFTRKSQLMGLTFYGYPY